MFRIAIALVLLVLVVGAPARAADTHTVELPHAGLSVDVPADWKVEQYGDALLELTNGGLSVWIRRYDAAAVREPAREWTLTPEGGARCMARIGRDGVTVFEVEANLPDAEQRDVVDALLESIDTTPYFHPTRHVDWKTGWTLTLPVDWKLLPGIRKEQVHFEAEDRTARLWVESLLELLKVAGGEGATPEDLDAWADLAWKEGLKRIQEAEGVKAEVHGPTIETVERGDSEARRVHLGLDPDDEGRPRGWMHVLVVDGFRVLAWARAVDDEVDAAMREAVASFRLGTDPGPRAPTAEPTDRFPGEKGPAVVFALPTGWKVTPGTNSMRVAQVVPSDSEGLEVVVFFFGAGGGGDVDGNLDRWRGQMGNPDGGTVETYEPAESVKITLLDVTGAYASSQMNPHGRDPHGGDDGEQGGSRMLGAIVEVPGGPLFLKLVGPEDAVAEQAAKLKTWLLSFRPAR